MVTIGLVKSSSLKSTARSMALAAALRAQSAPPGVPVSRVLRFFNGRSAMWTPPPLNAGLQVFPPSLDAYLPKFPRRVEERFFRSKRFPFRVGVYFRAPLRGRVYPRVAVRKPAVA